jgi:multidrug resistance efflux pump
MQGRRCIIKSVSGLDSVERRSEQVKSLGKLASAVVQANSPLWFTGSTDNLPPKIERLVRKHVENAHSRTVAVIPLLSPVTTSDDGDPFEQSQQPETGAPVGALVIEQLSEASATPELKRRAELVASHAQTALANSVDHQSIFLMPLWKSIGKVCQQFQGYRLARTAMVLAVLTSILGFLCLYPYPFYISASGSLVPERQHEVYAQLDGILTEIKVSNMGDSIVEQGQLLAEMKSSVLELKIGDIQGRIQQATKEREFAEAGKTSGDDQAEIDAYTFQFERASQTIKNLERELVVQQKDLELLKVRAPIAGQVVNWQVRQNLLRRPVRFGQHLMTIVPPDTQWLIELELPERRIAHLSREMQESDELIKVTFALHSLPGREFEGELLSLDQRLDVYSEEGNAALVRVRFENDSIPAGLFRSGTRVTGKVRCGTCSVGYAMFYELIETAKSKWQFWF